MAVVTAGRDVRRFDGVERAVHWATALLLGVLLATAAVLYLPSLAAAVGRRALVRDVHVASGFLLPVPFLLALSGRWGRRLAADLTLIDRWDATDRAWLRSLGRSPGAQPGKFNAGQTLHAAFIGGAVVVMLGTGSVMHWPGPFPLSWRTGATFVHDWTAIALAVVIAGHIGMAVTHPQSLRGILTGQVRRAWAERRHPRWQPDDDALEPGAGESGAGEPGAIGPAAVGPAGPVRGRRLQRPEFAVMAIAGVVLAASVAVAADGRGGPGAEGPTAVARRFQAALERNELERAYGLLGPSARAARPRETFFQQRLRAQQDRYLDPGQKEPYPREISVQKEIETSEESQRRILLRVAMSDGKTLWRQVEVKQAGGRWKVDGFRQLLGDPCRDPQDAPRWRCATGR
jgi:formate dehydrogenase subunit gamma